MPRNVPVGSTPKLQAICSEIYDLALQLGPEARLPTVVELRERLGVSVATLNTALKELETQNVVARKHGVGIFVASSLKQKTVSLLSDSSFFRSPGHSPFWESLLETAKRRAVSHNERFEMHFASLLGAVEEPLQQSLTREIYERRVHGIVGVGLDEFAARWMEEQKMPFVALFGPAFGPLAVQVMYDDEAMLRTALEAFKSRGCRRVGVWSPIAPKRPTFLGLMKFEDAQRRSAFALAGQEFDERLVENNLFLAPAEGDQTLLSHQEQGFETAQRVFCRPRAEWPDAVVVTDDMMAHGALMAFKKLDVEVGRDFQFATHANAETTVFLGHKEPMLLLEFNTALAVENMFDALEKLMDGHKPAAHEIFITPTLREV